LASTVIKNWDKKNWLSSRGYVDSFNKFLIRQIKLNQKSKILDIGCGRGKILGTLSSMLRLKKKPLGIDIMNHSEKDKRINFKQINAETFFFKNKIKFDLIIIKQTIHLLNLKEIKKLLNLLKKNLTKNGKILIFTLDTQKNEIPTFKLMKTKLDKSFKRDKKIFKLITKLHKYKKNRFFYKVNISKKKYLRMIKERYMSILLPITKYELQKGIDEINYRYKKNIKFTDKLICVTL
jgi:ubiquinone/menaquinone biosynthesis C-methylase UbiE